MFSSTPSEFHNWLGAWDSSLPASELLLFHPMPFSQVIYLFLCVCSHHCVARRSGWWDCARPRRAHAVVCMFDSLWVTVCPSVCTATALGCVIEMEMSQSMAAVVFHLALRSLRCSISAKLPMFVTVWKRVCWKCLAPPFLTQGPEEMVWKCNQLVITIISSYLTNTQALTRCPADFPGPVLWPTAHWDSCGIPKTCNYHHLTISFPSKFAP